jgi:hypothetical protein
MKLLSYQPYELQRGNAPSRCDPVPWPCQSKCELAQRNGGHLHLFSRLGKRTKKKFRTANIWTYCSTRDSWLLIIPCSSRYGIFSASREVLSPEHTSHRRYKTWPLMLGASTLHLAPLKIPYYLWQGLQVSWAFWIVFLPHHQSQAA